MKVLVGVKRVIDYAVKVRIRPDKKAVELNNVKMSMNPFCEIAVEEAVKLKEKGIASEILAVSIGPKQSQEVLRTALAMGADRAMHVTTDLRLDQELLPLHVSKIFKKIADDEKPDLILMGKQSIDGDFNQTPQMLAGLLDYPQAMYASSIEFGDDKQSIQVTRETDGGLQTLKLKLPAVVSCDLRLNEPRYATLPNIVKARKKPIESVAADSLGVDLESPFEILSVEEPPSRKGGIFVESVEELVDKLKNEAKVL